MLTSMIDYRYLRSTRPNDAKLITNPSPNKAEKGPQTPTTPLPPTPLPPYPNPSKNPPKKPNNTTQPDRQEVVARGGRRAKRMNSYQLAGKGKAIYSN